MPSSLQLLKQKLNMVFLAVTGNMSAVEAKDQEMYSASISCEELNDLSDLPSALIVRNVPETVFKDPQAKVCLFDKCYLYVNNKSVCCINCEAR